MLRKAIIFTSLILLVLIDGCLDPKGVSEMVSTGVDTIDLFSTYAKDLKASCARKASVMPADERPDCNKFDKGYAGFITVRQTLTSYLVNLQRLADKDGITYSEDLDSLQKTITDAKIFNNDKLNAVSDLSRLLLEGATSIHRRKNLKYAIDKADPSFGKIMDGLIEFLNKQYKTGLNQELDEYRSRKSDIDIDRKKHITIALADGTTMRVSKIDSLAAETKTAGLDQMISATQKKAASIEKCIEALTNLKDAHHQLKVHSNDLDAIAVIDSVKVYGKKLRSLHTQIRDAFN